MYDFNHHLCGQFSIVTSKAVLLLLLGRFRNRHGSLHSQLQPESSGVVLRLVEK